MAEVSSEIKARVTADLFSALKAAIEFDVLQDKGASGQSLAGTVKSWAEQRFEKDLLVRRAVVDRLAQDLDFGHQVLLVGANGGGKSCVLLALNALLRTNEHGLDEPFDLIIFNGNHHKDTLQRLPSQAEKENFIIEDCCKRISRNVVGKNGQWLEEFSDYATQFADEFEDFRTSYDYDSSAGRQKTFADNPGARDAWHLAKRMHSQAVPVERLRLYAKYERSRGRRLALIIDNCDYFSDSEIDAAGAAAAKLYSASGISIPVIVAARPVTARRVQNIMNIAFDEIRYVNLYDAITREYLDDHQQLQRYVNYDAAQFARDIADAFDIFDKRLKLFSQPRFLVRLRKWARRTYREKDLPDAHRFATQLMIEMRGHAEIVLRNYFDFAGGEFLVSDDDTMLYRFSGEARQDLTRVFLMWHNGSIRELAMSLVEFALRQRGLLLLPDSLILNALHTSDSILAVDTMRFEGEEGVSERTALFRHVFFHGTERASGERFPVMHSSVRVLDDEYSVGGFSFPRARTLQYLNRRRADGTVSVRSIEEGLSKLRRVNGVLDGALAGLVNRPGYGSGLIRIDGLDVDHLGRQIVPEVFDRSYRVELLPAGALLITRLIYTVEYQYWATVASEDSRETVADELKIRRNVMATEQFLGRPHRRIEVALAFALKVLVPVFAHDFPFILDGNRPNDADALRLRAYAENFGFGKGKWHITRILQNVQLYVRAPHPHVLSPDSLKQYGTTSVRLFSNLMAVSNRLDEAFERGRKLGRTI